MMGVADFFAILVFAERGGTTWARFRRLNAERKNLWRSRSADV